MDSEKYVQDTTSSVNHFLLYHQVTLNAKKSPVFSAMKKSGVLSSYIPKAHFFPEFISWLVSSMYPGKCLIMNSQGENVLQVSMQLIRQALCFPENESTLQFSEDSLAHYFENFSGEEFDQCMSHLRSNSKEFRLEGEEFSLEVFDLENRPK